MKSWIKIAFVLLAIMIVDQAFAQGCSQCRRLSDQGSGNGGMEEATFVSNINYGILYLMAVPYILLMVFFRKKIISGFKSLIGK